MAVLLPLYLTVVVALDECRQVLLTHFSVSLLQFHRRRLDARLEEIRDGSFTGELARLLQDLRSFLLKFILGLYDDPLLFLKHALDPIHIHLFKVVDVRCGLQLLSL